MIPPSVPLVFVLSSDTVVRKGDISLASPNSHFPQTKSR